MARYICIMSCVLLPDCVGKGEVDSTQAVPRLPTAAHGDEQKIPTGIYFPKSEESLVDL